MIPKAGIEGAAAATLLGYMVSNIICAAVLCKMKLMTISGRFFLTFGLSAVYFVMWRLFYSDKTLIGLALAVLFSCGIALLYKTELRFAAGRLKGMIRKRRKSGNGI
jgi:Na+-driven multidrug efflux pump